MHNAKYFPHPLILHYALCILHFIKEIATYGQCIVLDHPLIQHDLAILRDKETPVKEFRELISQISGLGNAGDRIFCTK